MHEQAWTMTSLHFKLVVRASCAAHAINSDKYGYVISLINSLIMSVTLQAKGSLVMTSLHFRYALRELRFPHCVIFNQAWIVWTSFDIGIFWIKNRTLDWYNACQRSWNTFANVVLFCDFIISLSEQCSSVMVEWGWQNDSRLRRNAGTINLQIDIVWRIRGCLIAMDRNVEYQEMAKSFQELSAGSVSK